MRETQFIDRNHKKWAEYEAALRRERQDPKLLSELYVHTTDDLSYSRTFYPNRSVRVYLNGLAQRTFLKIYRGRRGEAARFLTFWSDELPRIMFTNRRLLLLSLGIFVLAMLIGVVSYIIDPSFAELILSDNYMEMTRANIRNGDPMAVYKERGQFSMFLAITFNNVYVAFMTFIMGAFFAVGTVVILIRNGIMLGVFQYFFVDQGLFRESFLTIWIHGALEISSIVIAGAAGLVMGKGLLFPGTYSRLQAFGRSAREGLKIMLGTVPLFIIAGFLEGYLTRHTELHEGLRLFFILFCFAFVIWYFWVYPKIVVTERQSVLNKEPERRLKTVSEEPLRFDRIKMAGEILTDVFILLRRQGARLFPGLLLASLVFCLLVFGLT
ncbi:MAG: stage II sporulation protein M, partial [Bacteroidota bacterium]